MLREALPILLKQLPLLPFHLFDDQGRHWKLELFAVRLEPLYLLHQLALLLPLGAQMGQEFRYFRAHIGNENGGSLGSVLGNLILQFLRPAIDQPL
jgi:hypothetical protein